MIAIFNEVEDPKLTTNSSTGGYYDLIAFDTRYLNFSRFPQSVGLTRYSGTGTTLPFSCYNSDLDRATQGTFINRVSNASDTTAGLLWTAYEGLAQQCYEKNKDIGELLSTAFVARDMMQIVDALGEDGMLRFWGTFTRLTILEVISPT